MGLLDRLNLMLDRFGSYPWWAVLIELAVIWIVVAAVIRFVQGTRAAGALKALLLIIVVATALARVFGGEVSLGRLAYLYDRALAIFAVALVVIFQPELRRALIRLGEGNLFRSAKSDVERVVASICEASVYCSKTRFGALIVVERGVGLRGLVEGGTDLDAEVSSRLIQTIFFPGSALHDLAIVIKGDRIRSAGVQLPLADPADMPDPELGSRHRAAVGLTKESDALVVVVSEESGFIRLTERGYLSKPLTEDELRGRLLEALGETRGTSDDEEGSRAGGEATGASKDTDKEDATVEGGMSDEPFDHEAGSEGSGDSGTRSGRAAS